MVIGLIGENCSGKSTLAGKIKSAVGAEIITGKDYLRMARSESEAEALFKEKLRKAVDGENLIYVISEPDQLKMLPDGAVRILVHADLDTIKERFAARMHGHLPEPVARMLEKKHGIFDTGTYDCRFDGVTGDADALCEELKKIFAILIRPLGESETEAALQLAWKVFTEYESPVYAPEGTEEFKKSIHDENYLAGIRYYGAFDGQALVGVIGIRHESCHICFFFVDGQYHRRGIGTKMFQSVLEDYPGRKITLNSAPYGLPFYQKLGFTATGEEQTVNGIRFTPMEYKCKE